MRLLPIVVLVIGVLSGCAGAASTPAATSPPSSTPATDPTASTAASASGALTQQFTSSVHGISVGYPAGWHVRLATIPWTSAGNCQECPYTDVIYRQETDSPFIAVASQALGDRSIDAWFEEQLQVFIDDDPSCAGPTEAITVDGGPAVLQPDCMFALTSAGDRGYLIWLYRDEDRRFLDAILESVTLRPEDAMG
jgi:hypothetical protein